MLLALVSTVGFMIVVSIVPMSMPQATSQPQPPEKASALRTESPSR